MSRVRTDESAKLAFIGQVVADLLRILHPALAAALDLDAIEPLPTEYIGHDRTKRLGDAAFRVPVRPQHCRGPGRRYLIVMAEFQSRDDASMHARVADYRARMLAHYRHQGLIGEDENPPVLALVVNTGDRPWRAHTGAESLEGLSDSLAAHLAPYQPQAYIAVEAGPSSELAWPEGNWAGAVVRLARCGTREALLEGLRQERARFPDAAQARFRRGLQAWAEERLPKLPGSVAALPSFEELEGTKEAEVPHILEERAKQWTEDWLAQGRSEGRAKGHSEGLAKGRTEGLAKGRTEGLAKGRSEGQRMLLAQMARTRFGAQASARLAEALDNGGGVTLAELADWVATCADAEEFAARLEDGTGGSR